jgi:hypothetical protein
MTTASSPARQLANAANARRSTGPRTDPGRARSSQNARTHGLTAKHLKLAEDEREEFEQFLAEYRADSQPQGPIQETLFHELVLAAWNLRRIGRMEAALYALAPDPLELAQNEDLFRKLDRLETHRSRILAVYVRSLRELRALQTNLAMAATLPPEVVGIMPPLASATHLAKRTQHITRRAASSAFQDSDLADIALNAAARANQLFAEQEKRPDTAVSLSATAA